MTEPSPASVARADLLIAVFLAKQRAGHLPSIGVSDVILAIAEAFTDLELALASLLEGIDGGADGGEVVLAGPAFQARVNAARAELWRHRGQPPGRV